MRPRPGTKLIDAAGDYWDASAHAVFDHLHGVTRRVAAHLLVPGELGLQRTFAAGQARQPPFELAHPRGRDLALDDVHRPARTLRLRHAAEPPECRQHG